MPPYSSSYLKVDGISCLLVDMQSQGLSKPDSLWEESEGRIWSKMARLERIHDDIALKYLHRSFNVSSMISCKVYDTENFVEKAEERRTALGVNHG